MSSIGINVQILDAAYKPFPSFKGWEAKVAIDEIRWNRYKSLTASHKRLSADALNRSQHVATRAAALDTGAIEGLYEVDRGFTYTVAFEATSWEAALAAKGEGVRSLFEAQLLAYDYVLSLATTAEPLSEAAIRALHEVVCDAQSTYQVSTSLGPQDQSLPKGKYKSQPNHVRTRNGTDHSYAPVDMTPAEMERLLRELRSEAFSSAHPVLQASYAHYCLVAIHPFADGNGRVARALASAFTYRAISMPIVILSEHKVIYLDALEEADRGDYQTFVDFMFARALDTMQLVSDSVRSASSPDPQTSLDALASLYLTRGGYSYENLDDAASRLITATVDTFKTTFSDTLKNSSIRSTLSLGSAQYKALDPAYRTPLNGGQTLNVRLSSPAPAAAEVGVNFGIYIPKDPNGEDDMQLRILGSDQMFAARIDELIPAISGITQLRIRMFSEQTVRKLLAELTVSAQRAIRIPR
jgi:Fic family protein